MWYLIVSVPDLCLLSYFVYAAVTAAYVVLLNAAVNAAAADLVVVVVAVFAVDVAATYCSGYL